MLKSIEVSNQLGKVGVEVECADSLKSLLIDLGLSLSMLSQSIK